MKISVCGPLNDHEVRPLDHLDPGSPGELH